jgi:hypothetical protein
MRAVHLHFGLFGNLQTATAKTHVESILRTPCALHASNDGSAPLNIAQLNNYVAKNVISRHIWSSCDQANDKG